MHPTGLNCRQEQVFSSNPSDRQKFDSPDFDARRLRYANLVTNIFVTEQGSIRTAWRRLQYLGGTQHRGALVMDTTRIHPDTLQCQGSLVECVTKPFEKRLHHSTEGFISTPSVAGRMRKYHIFGMPAIIEASEKLECCRVKPIAPGNRRVRIPVRVERTTIVLDECEPTSVRRIEEPPVLPANRLPRSIGEHRHCTIIISFIPPFGERMKAEFCRGHERRAPRCFGTSEEDFDPRGPTPSHPEEQLCLAASRSHVVPHRKSQPKSNRKVTRYSRSNRPHCKVTCNRSTSQ